LLKGGRAHSLGIPLKIPIWPESLNLASEGFCLHYPAHFEGGSKEVISPKAARKPRFCNFPLMIHDGKPPRDLARPAALPVSVYFD
jgi:hypothetical protein